ncbi:MAG: DUF3021 domain-containing protein [Clostridiales bacterium]|nr:DUF3021 domain-containing protein [Clostridiales bacterium]
MESWSIAKQTGLYFAVLSLTLLPIAYLTEWMEHSVTGFLIYFGIFVAIFVIIWVAQYFFWKNKISRFNSKIEKP